MRIHGPVFQAGGHWLLLVANWFVDETHVFPDELGDGAGQHEAGDGAAHDVEQGVHDPRAGGRFDRGTEGTAERAGSWTTAAADLRRRRC